MNIESKNIKEKIIAVFEATRELPGESYDENSIVLYLVENPTGYGSIHNTFKGKRRLSKFLKAIESEFLICFSLKDWEALVSLDQIEKRINYLLATPKSSITTIRNRLKDGPPDMLALVVCILCLPIIGIFFKLFGVKGLASLIIPTILVLLIYHHFYWKEQRYYKELKNKIEANQSIKGDV